MLPVLSQLPSISQNIIALGAILVFGIPHGAIDNILFLQKSKASPARFYFFYLAAIALNVLLWFIFPILSMIVFLAISSYHFGQSQFESTVKLKMNLHFLFYFAWGLSVIMGFVYFNLDELANVIYQENDLAVFAVLVQPKVILGIYLGSLAISLAFLVGAVVRKVITKESFFIEMLVLVLVFAASYLFNFLIGFALFFVTIHSFKVMRSEFYHFYKKVDYNTLSKFVKKLMPLTLLSLMGIAMLMGMIYLGYINLSYALALQITISSITLPHVFVMERFYQA
jgi:Brp/Blh family beta-carotene 15,15'-monooxygenase